MSAKQITNICVTTTINFLFVVVVYLRAYAYSMFGGVPYGGYAQRNRCRLPHQQNGKRQSRVEN